VQPERLEINYCKLRSNFDGDVEGPSGNDPRQAYYSESKDMIIFRKTSYRYEDGKELRDDYI
jgi:hypothetical protein